MFGDGNEIGIDDCVHCACLIVMSCGWANASISVVNVSLHPED